jgi:hypothetical protein
VANQPSLPVNVAERDAFIEPQRNGADSAELGAKATFSNLRAALEGNEHKRKSPG